MFLAILQVLVEDRRVEAFFFEEMGFASSSSSVTFFSVTFATAAGRVMPFAPQTPGAAPFHGVDEDAVTRPRASGVVHARHSPLQEGFVLS